MKKMKDEIILFDEKKDCSGCGTCMNACPRNAISMIEDEYGFFYPKIDDALCIKCGICKKTCGIQNSSNLKRPDKVYALATRNKESLLKSASGGAFEAMARYVLKEGGIVYGVELSDVGDMLTPRHIAITEETDLYRLQGSKYVQSDTGYIYKEIIEYAKEGRLVLFSGTPCQNAGLKRILGQDYPSVILVDIVCHGVPNSRLFKDFLRYRQIQLKSEKIKNFYFRDKRFGQGYTTKTVYQKNGRVKEKVCKGEIFAYIRFFSKSLTLRESCYNCPFASSERLSDITIGDYWGFAEEFKECKSLPLDDELGVSCVLVNTDKGIKLLKKINDQVIKIETDYHKILRHNKQLNAPTIKPPKREYILEVYKKYGYEYLEKEYWKMWPVEKIKYLIGNFLPKSIKKVLKKYG